MWSLLIVVVQSGSTVPDAMVVQEPFVYIPEETIREALKVILGTGNFIDTIPLHSTNVPQNCTFRHLTSLTLLPFPVSIYPDARNQPVLIHCKRGKASLLRSSWFSSASCFHDTTTVASGFPDADATSVFLSASHWLRRRVPEEAAEVVPVFGVRRVPALRGGEGEEH
jgi:hypothetical protein